MKRSMFLVALLVLAPFTAATVHAQGSGDMLLTLSSTSGTAAVLNSTISSLRVTNDGLQPMTVTLSTDAPASVGVTYSRNAIQLLPTQSSNVTLTFKAKTNASVGTHNITITASDTSFGGTADDASATYALTVTPMYIPPPASGTGEQDDAPATQAPRAPTVNPGDVNLTVTRGEASGITIEVTNPAIFAQRFNTTASFPAEWTLDGAPTTFVLGGLERRLFSLTITAGQAAEHGEGVLTFANGSASSTIAFHLRTSVPSSSPSTDTGTGNQETNDTGASSTTTGNGTGNASASSRASGEVGPPELVLDVTRVDIIPGGTATATVTVISNQPSARRVDFDIVSPEGLTAGVTPASFTLPAWESVNVTMTFEASETLETGAFRFVTLRISDASDVRLTINVKVVDEVTLQPASLAPETAAAGGSPLRSNTGFIIGGTAIAGGLIALLVALFFVRRAAAGKKPDIVRAIEGLVKRRPGIKAQDLHEALDATANAFESGLKKLVKAGTLAVLGEGEARRIYPVDQIPVAAAAKTVARAPAVLTPTDKPVHERAFRVIVERGPLTSNQLAVALGIASATLEHHVERLVIAGRVEVRIEDGQRVLDLPQPGSS